MYVQFKEPLMYWNYFLSIEKELITTSKYVEFSNENLMTYSTEFTKIILTACSEVDVLLSQISKMYGLKKRRPNFKDHYEIVENSVSTLISEKLFLDGYGLGISPFEEWKSDQELKWHKSYNNLKHKRGDHYKEGNLENALLSVGALFSTSIHYYLCTTSKSNPDKSIRLYNIVNSIKQKSKLYKFQNELCR